MPFDDFFLRSALLVGFQEGSSGSAVRVRLSFEFSRIGGIGGIGTPGDDEGFGNKIFPRVIYRRRDGWWWLDLSPLPPSFMRLHSSRLILRSASYRSSLRLFLGDCDFLHTKMELPHGRKWFFFYPTFS